MTSSNPITQSRIRQDRANPAQSEAITHGQGPLLIVAGAGTGKTAVITKRIAWLILEKNLKPEEILALTFTDKAAGEMEERVDRLLPYGYAKLYISTFHSFAEQTLRNHALDIGLSPDFKLLDTTGQWMLVRKYLDRFALKYYKPLGNPTKFIHALLQHFSRAKDELITPSDYLKYVEDLKLNRDSEIIMAGVKVEGELRDDEIARLEEVANAYHVYEQCLLEEGALDFGGVISRLVELFQKRPQILDIYRKQFKYILIDEFQDTNHAQYELVKLLAGPKNNLTVVSDDDQSIYRFRGAAISNVLQFKDDYPKSREIFLVNNYRSCQNILDLAYTFIQQNNPNRLEVRLKDTGLSKQLKAQLPGQAPIMHLHGKDTHEETRLVLETIAILKQKNPELSWNDFAILVRANDHAGMFIRALDEARLPYSLIAPRGLYGKPVILDIVSYLRVLIDYHNSPALYRVLTSPIANLSDVDITNLLYWAKRKSWSLYQILRQASVFNFSATTVAECTRIIGLIEKHTNLARRAKTSQIIYAVLEDTGYLKKLTKTDNEENRAALNFINQFYRKAVNFETQTDNASLIDFLELLDLEINSGEQGSLPMDPSEGPESIKILTCHAAKGLEFPYVFIANLVDRRFPTTERRDPIELPDALVKEITTEGDVHLEEERRLFYVACTRAKKGLFFTSAEDYGGTRKKKLSRFLQELEGLGVIKTSGGPQGATLQQCRVGASPLEAAASNWACPPPSESLPKYFSYTQLKAFESCPKQYKFAHILKIPVKGKASFSFGKTIHATLQKFCDLIRTRTSANQSSLFDRSPASTDKFPVSQNELLEFYEQSWIDDWFEDEKQKKEYYEKGKKGLKRFYEDAEKNPPSPIYIEQGFSLKIGDNTLRGVIDRVDRAKDGLEIIDYKTGSAKTEEQIKRGKMNEQLYLYQIAAEEVFKEKAKSLAFYYVEDGKQVSFLGTPENLTKLKEKIKEQIEEIKKSSFPATPSKQRCCYCDFKEICESRIL